MKSLNFVTLLSALWSSTVLFEWVRISDAHSAAASFSLTGSELSQPLTLLPAIVILISLIARYRKIPNQIMFFAAATATWAGYLAVTLNPATTPAAISGLEKLTGISGIIGAQELSFAPAGYSLLAFAVAGFSIAAAISKTEPKRSNQSQANQEASDPRSIWDSQS